MIDPMDDLPPLEDTNYQQEQQQQESTEVVININSSNNAAADDDDEFDIPPLENSNDDELIEKKKEKNNNNSSSSLSSSSFILSYKDKTIHQAAQEGDLPTVSLLLSWNQQRRAIGSSADEANIHQVTDIERQATILHWAAYSGHDDLVSLLLTPPNRSNPLYVPPTMKEGQNALMWSIIAGKMSTVMLLFSWLRIQPRDEEEEDNISMYYRALCYDEQGCGKDVNGNSIYILACQNNHLQIFQYLIHLYREEYMKKNNDATFNMLDHLNGQCTSLFIDSEKHTVLHWAVYNGDYNLTRCILYHCLLHNMRYPILEQSTAGEYIPSSSTSSSSLNTQKRIHEIWEYMTRSDESTNRTVFHWAARRGHLHTMEMIVSFVLSHLCDGDDDDCDEELDIIIDGDLSQQKHVFNNIYTQLRRELFDKRDSEQLTPYEWAKLNRHSPIVNFLDQYQSTYSAALKDKINSNNHSSSSVSISIELKSVSSNGIEEQDDEDEQEEDEQLLNEPIDRTMTRNDANGHRRVNNNSSHHNSEKLNGYESIIPLLRASSEEETNWYQLKTNKLNQLLRVPSIILILLVSSLLMNLVPVPVACLLFVFYVVCLVLMMKGRGGLNFKEARDGLLVGVYLGSMLTSAINYSSILYPLLLYGNREEEKGVSSSTRPTWAWWLFVQFVNLWLLGLMSMSLFTYVRLVYTKTNPGFLNNSIRSQGSDSRRRRVNIWDQGNNLMAKIWYFINEMVNNSEDERVLVWSNVDEQILKQYQKGVTPSAQEYCLTCNIRKPMRSKHDSVTNRCVSRFDHFCSWIQMPVGRANHLEFLFYLTSTELYGLAQISLIILCSLIQFNSNPSNKWNTPSILYHIFYGSGIPLGVYYFNFVIMSLLALPIGLLTFTSLRNVAFNLTTNELMNAQRYPWIILLKPVKKNDEQHSQCTNCGFRSHLNKAWNRAKQVWINIGITLRGGVFNVMDDGVANNWRELITLPASLTSTRGRSPNSMDVYQSYTLKPFANHFLQSMNMPSPVHIDHIQGPQYDV